MNPAQFIKWIGQKAANAYGSGLFPSVLIAQAALESGWGKSVLANTHNNLFGIKADGSWKGQVAVMPTREVVKGQSVTISAKFRKYHDPKDSISDRNAFLKKHSRYKKAGVFSAETPQIQAEKLQKAGYATDPNYASAIIKLIQEYDLEQFDLMGKKKGESN